MILELNAQEACHSECLAGARRRLAGRDRIPVKFMRGGKTMETVVDVAATRRNFLKP